MRPFLATLLCRFTGRYCSPQRPASRDLIHEMRDHGRKAEAETVNIRRRRVRGTIFADDAFPRQGHTKEMGR